MSQIVENSSTAYAAVLLYESVSAGPGAEPLYEETITLIWAESKEEAESKAREYAKTRECAYTNEAGETVEVSLKSVLDVSEVTDDLGKTADIYTRHFRNYDAYRSFEPLLGGTPL